MGDALAVTGLWELVKNALVKEEFIVDENADGETDDEDFFYSDDEEDDLFDMDSFKYLDFSRDRPFVNRLINEIEDKNVGLHSLMLLAFNLQNENNSNFLSENYSQEIFNKTVLRLSQDNVDLPVARCAACIIQHFVEGDALQNIDDAQMRTIIQTVLQWSRKDTGKTVTPTSSEETSCRLTSVLGGLTEAMSGTYDMQDDLQQIYDETAYPSVQDNIGELLEAQN